MPWTVSQPSVMLVRSTLCYGGTGETGSGSGIPCLCWVGCSRSTALGNLVPFQETEIYGLLPWNEWEWKSERVRKWFSLSWKQGTSALFCFTVSIFFALFSVIIFAFFSYVLRKNTIYVLCLMSLVGQFIIVTLTLTTWFWGELGVMLVDIVKRRTNVGKRESEYWLILGPMRRG